MQYHDSARPRGPNGRPLYLTPGGWLAALPNLTMAPEPDGTHRVSVMLLVGPNEAQWFHCTTADLAPLLDSWGADPEATMEQHFGWKWKGGTTMNEAGTRAKPGISLEDLLS